MLRRALILSTVIGAGCASQRSGGTSGGAPEDKTESGFPTEKALEEIKTLDLPDESPSLKYHAVAEWTLEGPFPEAATIARFEGTEPWDQLLVQIVDAKGGLLYPSTAMHCVAREMSRFYLEHQAQPSPGLRYFILARCRAAPTEVAVAVVFGDMPAGGTPQALFEQWKKQVEDMIRATPTGTRSIGLAFGQAESGRVVFMLVSGKRHAHLASVRTSTAGVRLEGELLEQAASARALINRGRFGYGDCAFDPATRLPRFVITCPVDPNDDAPWIEVGAYPPGRVIGVNALRLLIAEESQAPKHYARSAYGGDLSATGDLAQNLVTVVNAARAEAGLSTLTVAGAQSEVATEVAPYYFAAFAGIVPQTVADTVALGLRAGWKVEGAVRGGYMTAVADATDADPASIAGAALDRPFGRETLLNPAARAIAVGPVVAEKLGISGAVILTYAFYEKRSHGEDVARVLERLREVRREAGRSAPGHFEQLDDDGEAIVATIQSDHVEPRQALREMLNRASAELKKPVTGWVFEALDLDSIEFPEKLLLEEKLQVGIAVGPYRPEGEPWARYVIIIVLEAPPQTI